MMALCSHDAEADAVQLLARDVPVTITIDLGRDVTGRMGTGPDGNPAEGFVQRTVSSPVAVRVPAVPSQSDQIPRMDRVP